MSEDRIIKKIESKLALNKKKKKKLTPEFLEILAKLQGKSRLTYENKGLNKVRKMKEKRSE